MRSGGSPGSNPGQDAGERDAAARLSVGDRQKRLRRFWRSIPSAPRCKLCHRPFGGLGGPIVRLAGLGRWPGNPKYCRGCFQALYRRRAGAEIECSLLFADVRDSTPMAESLAACRVPPANGSILCGRVRRAGCPRRVRRHVGVGVNSGVAYVGAVGTDEHVEFTALGDPVNVAARLAGEARAGEVLIPVAPRSDGGVARRQPRAPERGTEGQGRTNGDRRPHRAATLADVLNAPA